MLYIEYANNKIDDTNEPQAPNLNKTTCSNNDNFIEVSARNILISKITKPIFKKNETRAVSPC